MQKKEWLISICILCALVLVSAGLTAFALHQHQPEKVEAFENRYLNMEEMALEPLNGMQAKAYLDRLTLTWEAGTEALQMITQPRPIEGPCKEWQLDLAGGGKQNTIRRDQWGYRVWLELRTLKGNEIVSSARTEMLFEAVAADRARVYTLSAAAEEADAWQLCVEVEPMDGERAAGSMILEHWEVWGK